MRLKRLAFGPKLWPPAQPQGAFYAALVLAHLREYERLHSMISGIPTPRWQKSSLSGNDGCVEWRIDEGGVRLRDTKQQDSPELRFTHKEWIAFLGAVRNGEADNARFT
jgi:hypothetical protein